MHRLQMPDSGFSGDPWQLSPRQLVAYAVLAQEEEARRDERLYTVMLAASSVAQISDPAEREKADHQMRTAIRGTQ